MIEQLPPKPRDLTVAHDGWQAPATNMEHIASNRQQLIDQYIADRDEQIEARIGGKHRQITGNASQPISAMMQEQQAWIADLERARDWWQARSTGFQAAADTPKSDISALETPTPTAIKESPHDEPTIPEIEHDSDVHSWIACYATGASFADVGRLWGTVNEDGTIAARAGAASATMVDITPLEEDLWTRFEARCEEHSVTELACKQAGINNRVVSQIEPFDIVHCIGVLSHCPDPLSSLRSIAGPSRDVLIVATIFIPGFAFRGRAGDLGAYCVADLSDLEKEVMASYFRAADALDMPGSTTPTDWDDDDYDPWCWRFTEDSYADL